MVDKMRAPIFSEPAAAAGSLKIGDMNRGEFDELTDKDFLKLRNSIDDRLRELENHCDGEHNGVS
jgi:hypothetical protein